MLVSAFEKVKGDNQQLQEQNAELQARLKQREKEFVELEERYSQLKLAKSLSSSAKDVHDAKIKVNRIVREIDKCIALLNR
ncbi:MAG: hypothetical protein JXR57_03940 [Bacteroidales bacterium]|nr:hypothetical protein [Bacteroidales bacterium]